MTTAAVVLTPGLRRQLGLEKPILYLPGQTAAIELSGLPRSADGRTLLVLVQQSCPECRAQAPFLADVVAAASRLGIRSAMITPTVARQPSHELASQIGIPPEAVLVADFSRLSVARVPALILVDSKTVVLHAWNDRQISSRDTSLLAAFQLDR